jgi:hypothetical protein
MAAHNRWFITLPPIELVEISWSTGRGVEFNFVVLQDLVSTGSTDGFAEPGFDYVNDGGPQPMVHHSPAD